MGESDKAIAEYETYLKLYPKGEGADRVRQRLAVMGGSAKVASADKAKRKSQLREIHENTVLVAGINTITWHTHSYNSDGTRYTSA